MGKIIPPYLGNSTPPLTVGSRLKCTVMMEEQLGDLQVARQANLTDVIREKKHISRSLKRVIKAEH
jgi:hypothetical protein